MKEHHTAGEHLDSPVQVAPSPICSASVRDYFLWLFRKLHRFRINGSSMKPTICHGEEVLINRLAYQSSTPQIGDVVLIEHPYVRRQLMVKRITELVYQNGEIRFHVQGDNRAESTDSRAFGTLTKQRILGKITSRFL